MEELARPLSVQVSVPPKRVREGGTGVEVVVNSPAGENGGRDAPRRRGTGEAGGAGDLSLSSVRVIFAGEAMHPQFFSTAHGGFETGRRAARDVLASLGRNGTASAAEDESAPLDKKTG